MFSGCRVLSADITFVINIPINYCDYLQSCLSSKKKKKKKERTTGWLLKSIKYQIRIISTRYMPQIGWHHQIIVLSLFGPFSQVTSSTELFSIHVVNSLIGKSNQWQNWLIYWSHQLDRARGRQIIICKLRNSFEWVAVPVNSNNSSRSSCFSKWCSVEFGGAQR